MAGINKVFILGNLGADPEIRHFQNGDAVANLRIATSESWKDRNTGEAQERTEWHRVSVRGKLAEVAQKYLRKGSKVFIEGKLTTRKWQDQAGQERYLTEIVVGGIGSTLQMLDSKGGGSGGGNVDQGVGAASGGHGDHGGGGVPRYQDDTFEDIPF